MLSKHTLDCLSTCRSFVLCIASDDIYRDPLGNYRWGDASDGEPDPPGPPISAGAVDLLHSLGVLPGQDWKDPETQEWLNASLGYLQNGHSKEITPKEEGSTAESSTGEVNE